uniref:Transmembrane BAX inhibitor motif-containing protein 4 n=1 Tax=Wuchereria bancrofti TaxID=6293 RepID=A0A1I8ETH1_WUCBA
MSATVPLLLEEDIELGSPPSYKEAVDGERTLQNRSLQRHWFFDFNFGKATANFAPVIFANVGFLRKVFGILSLQLLITAVFCTALYVTSEIRLFLQQQLWIVFVSLIGSFILLFAMFIHARSVPLNYILLVSWTIMQSITVGAVVSFFDVKVVIEAVGLTALTVIALFFYTLQSKRDFRSHWAALFSISMIFLVASFVHLLTQSALFDFLLAAFGAVLFSIYLVFDIDRIMHHTSPEDYIEACVSLYLDIINLFLRISEILNEANRN